MFGEVVVVVEHLVSRGDSPEMVAEQVSTSKLALAASSVHHSSLEEANKFT